MGEVKETSVIIIGGGPTGLSLALGLAKHGVKSILLEKKFSLSKHSKAPVVHQRTREIFYQWGLKDKFDSRGNLVSNLRVISGKNEKILFSLDFNLLQDEAHNPGMLILKQSETERILLEAVELSGLCDVRFNTTALHFRENNDGVEVTALNENNEYIIKGKYLVGCDGASGFVRDSLGLSFPGKTYPVKTFLADVIINDKRNESVWPRFYNGKGEVTVAIRISTELWRLIHLEEDNGPNNNEDEIEEEKIQNWVLKTLGKGGFEKVWASPFKIHKRASPHFRVGRTLLAGDAAHVHSPVGGQGMNAGIQDAHNLAWKLAAVLHGGNEWRLLNSYETERKEAVVDKVSGNTDLMTRLFLQSPSGIRKLSFFFLRRILSIPGLREKFLRRVTMINLGYSNSEITDPGVTSAGLRLPNVELITPDLEKIRLYDLISPGIFILLIGEAKIKKAKLTQIPSIRLSPSHYIDVSGKIKKLSKLEKGFILIRPDLHIGWAGTSNEKLMAAVRKISGDPDLH